MNEIKKKVNALGLCSGGLDSILAGLVLERQGVKTAWVSFETPFFSADKARRASDMTGIPLIVEDITDRYLPMLLNPPAGYGRYMNPCTDCHALMFRIAAEIMRKTGADFLFSGEVMGQRPMSQTRSSLRYVEKNSGCEGLILRPLSAKLLPETEMEKNGLVDREQLFDFSGRGRKPQIEMAKVMGIVDYPAPAGGCRLTDPNFSNRLKDLFVHSNDVLREDLELLKYGRHLRFDPKVKLVAGRNLADNDRILSIYQADRDVKIVMKEIPGPAGLIPGGADDEMIRTGAAICAGYGRGPAGQPVEVHVSTPSGESLISVSPIKPDRIGHLMIL
jgi:tRNA-uridine 2-sulfurtransferase